MQVVARLAWFGIPPLVAGTFICAPERARFNTFVSPAHHFQATFPSAWFEYSDTNARAGILYITSFPPERRAEGVFIPRHGAEIVLRPTACSGSGLEEWVTSVTRGTEVISRRSLTFQNAAGTSTTGTEIVTRIELGPKAFLRQTAVCLSNGDVSFQARLAYWEGEKRAPEYMRSFDAVVRSVKSSP